MPNDKHGKDKEDKNQNDNVAYFPGKPGFYKKGPGQFKISFGSLDDLSEKAEKEPADEEGKGKHLKPVGEEEIPEKPSDH